MLADLNVIILSFYMCYYCVPLEIIQKNVYPYTDCSQNQKKVHIKIQMVYLIKTGFKRNISSFEVGTHIQMKSMLKLQKDV